MLESVDTIRNLILSLLQLVFGDGIVFLGLFELEFKLLTLTVALPLLVLLPVLDTLLVPLLHKASVALELVNLNASHFLLAHGSHLAIFLVGALSHTSLSLLLLLKLLHVSLHVQLLLGLVQSIDALLEELMLNAVVFFL